MALNKSQTSLIAKIIIALFGVVLIIGLAGPSVSGLMSLEGCSQSTTDPVSGGTVLESIASQYRPVAESWEGALASDPTSVTILVILGNLHSDWSFEIQQAIDTQGVDQGAYVPVAELAAFYYEEAVKQGATEPEVRIDMSIAFFYSDRLEEAISTVESVTAEVPDFAPAYYNGGIFYEAAGLTNDARAFFATYLELDPDGLSGNPDYARGRIEALGQAE